MNGSDYFKYFEKFEKFENLENLENLDLNYENLREYYNVKKV